LRPGGIFFLQLSTDPFDHRPSIHEWQHKSMPMLAFEDSKPHALALVVDADAY